MLILNEIINEISVLMYLEKALDIESFPRKMGE